MIKGIGTTVIESEQLANSVINHSGLFSENIPIILRSGVPSTQLLIKGHNFFLIRDLDKASAKSSA